MTDDFSRSRLDAMIDFRHPLATQIEMSLMPLFVHRDREGPLAGLLVSQASVQLA
ncbi:hypothetical protein [Burkholderia ubonensis]|uniref:hypothetical protein n=1 Tax=Burkholderia ubonensis TaxID=101571 RepID=UPI000B0E21DF|nr:hypothetical protein [Burkholderia ubonensis]